MRLRRGAGPFGGWEPQYGWTKGLCGTVRFGTFSCKCLKTDFKSGTSANFSLIINNLFMIG